MKIEIEQEDDGRWIAEVPDLPGVMTYGRDREEAISKVKALALRVLPIAWNTGKKCRTWETCLQFRREYGVLPWVGYVK